MKDNIKKIKKIAKFLKFTATAATVAMAIYTLIPKSEKIKDIDTLPLETFAKEIPDENTDKTDEQTVTE